MEIVRVRLRPLSPASDEHWFIRTPQMLVNRRNKHVRDTAQSAICREAIAQRVLGQACIEVIATEPLP